jgi:hypothetical protein
VGQNGLRSANTLAEILGVLISPKGEHMRATVYYLISPRRELLERALAQGASDFAEFILPIIWTAEESGRGNVCDNELDLLVKILYSGGICNLISVMPEGAPIFGEASPTADYFDSLWVLQRVPFDMTADMALSDLCLSGVIDRVPPTGNAIVDKLLADMRERRARPES